MKNLIIIGAGGMGRTMFDIARECVGFGVEFIVKGFLDNNLNSMDGFDNYPPLLGKVEEYDIEKDDVFTCSIGAVAVKKMLCSKIMMKGGKFQTLIHNTARIGTNALIGDGTIIAAYVSIGADSKLGNNAIVQAYSVVAHDVIVDDWVRIDTHVVCVGGITLENEVTIHTGAIINHKVVVESGATVGAGSFVIRRVKAGTTVYGNPAKRI